MSPTKAELQEQLKDAQARLGELEAQVEKLAEANRIQAGRIQELEHENQALQAGGPPGPLMGADLEAVGQVQALADQNQDLEQQVSRLQAQLDLQGQAPALGAEQVGGLVRELYEQLSGSFPGLSVRGGQLTMKFRTQPLAGKGGFMLASAGPDAPEASEVQEITLQFDRRGLSES